MSIATEQHAGQYLRTTTVERSFRVMGSDGHIIATSAAASSPEKLSEIVDEAVAYARYLESIWSRFIDSSEVSMLNRSAGTPFSVSPETYLLVQRACQAWTHTGGWFDPLQLNVLIELGYDRDFAELEGWEPDSPSSRSMSQSMSQSLARSLAPSCSDVLFDDEAMSITLPLTAGFDPGGIGKGLAADLVAQSMIAAGASGALVNLGGDLRSIGTSPRSEGWNIHIADDIAGGHNLQLRLASGAVATSTAKRRRWVGGNNHLVDPETSLSSDNKLKLVSVIASQAWQAELLATAIAVAGGIDRLPVGTLGEAAVLVTDDIRTVTHGPLKEYLAC